MGDYLNPAAGNFREALNSEIYVDKSELIKYTNQVIHTKQKYMCISRPRRFGKTMAADMLSAYYSCAENADELFAGLKIKNMDSYEEHKNKYNVLMINMQNFLSKSKTVDEMTDLLQKRIIRDLKSEYGEIGMDEEHLDWAMNDACRHTSRAFIILIDEWDCIFRVYKNNLNAQIKYLDFLRAWLKDQPYTGLVYMTGILPVKKYGTHSALNMFTEYSMISPKSLAGYFGFTEEEVMELCGRYQMDYKEMRAWYDGYRFKIKNYGHEDREISIYSPKSVVDSIFHRTYENYWNQTETYEALKIYIQMNYEGLKDDIIRMLAGESIKMNPDRFMNDMAVFKSRDDIFALLVHLGYLTFDFENSMAAIPNKEVSAAYISSIEELKWNEVIRSIQESDNLLKAVWDGNEEIVAQGIERVHQEVSIIQYNNESSLSYTLNLALYTAREYYIITREQPSGKGYIDICLTPQKRYAEIPAVIIELKWNKSAEQAVSQIKERNYVKFLEEHKDNLLLAGINYDAETKIHSCKIEKYKPAPDSPC